jgi:NDP-sugar pyrophosphorylase family protein
MSVYKNYDKYDRSNTSVGGGLVKNYSKQERTRDMVYIEYGANIFRKEVLDMVHEIVYNIEQLFPQLAGREELIAYEVNKRFYEIGSPRGLQDFEEFVTRG